MTFAFTAAGTKDQVEQQLNDAVKHHLRYTNPPEEIQKVVEVAKHWLSTGDYSTGVFVEANGHLGDYGGAMQLTIKQLNIPPHQPDTASQ